MPAKKSDKNKLGHFVKGNTAASLEKLKWKESLAVARKFAITPTRTKRVLDILYDFAYKKKQPWAIKLWLDQAYGNTDLTTTNTTTNTRINITFAPNANKNIKVIENEVIE